MKTRALIGALLTSCIVATPIATINGASAATAQNGLIYYLQSGPPDPMKPPSLTVKGLAVDGTEQEVTPFIKDLGATPSFSPDGKKIVVGKQDRSGRSIIVANPDGTNEVILAKPNGRPVGAQFSSDGSTIYFATSDGNMTTAIYAIDPSTPNQSLTGKDLFSHSGNITDFSVSSTGQAAFIDARGCVGNNLTGYGVFIKNLNDQNSATLLNDSCSLSMNGATQTTVMPQKLAWSADGSKLYISQVTITGTAGNPRTNLVIDEFTTSGRVNANTPLYVHPASAREIYAMAISPDNTKIAFYVKDGATPSTVNEIYVLDIASKVATKVKDAASSIGSMSWGLPVAYGSSSTPTESGSSNQTADTPAPVPGVTVTDTTIYKKAPAKVAGNSAITVLTKKENKTLDVVTKTPRICLPSSDDLVFIDEGRCIADVVNAKTRRVIRTLRTTVVEDTVSELKIGNEIAVLAPLYFNAGTAQFKTKSLKRLAGLKQQISAAGSVLVAGHSGVLLGNTLENVALARLRADATVKALRTGGAKGPFAVTSVGALDPVTKSKTKQDLNRRSIIILIP